MVREQELAKEKAVVQQDAVKAAVDKDGDRDKEAADRIVPVEEQVAAVV